MKDSAIIGILGGGQLGKMLAQAASHLGYRTHIYCSNAESPAFSVTPLKTHASYDDEGALIRFAQSVDIITCEFENVPAHVLSLLSSHTTVFPAHNAFHIAQHRMREKELITSLGLSTAPFYGFSDISGCDAAAYHVGFPCIIKTTISGYDGKGQYHFTQKEELDTWKNTHLAQVSAITPTSEHHWVMEKKIPFSSEVSVIIARNSHGDTKTFPAGDNIHKNGILHSTHVPSTCSISLLDEAYSAAKKLALALDIVGLLAVEFFVTSEGDLLVNEMAPRPHNSGHWTLDGCVTSQFEQHIRAICGLKLGATDIMCPTKMINLLGEEALKWQEYLKNSYAKPYLYGKIMCSEGRKMGHVNILSL